MGIDTPAREDSPDSSTAGTAGSNSLISQGYRRLAAMADERAAAAVGGGGSGSIGLNNRRVGGAPTPAAVLDYHARHPSPVRPPLPHEYDGVAPAPAAADHKRPAASMTGSGKVDGPNGSNRGGPPGREGAGLEHGGQFSQLQERPPMLSTPSAVGEDSSPAKKKSRPSVDGGERPVGVNGGGSARQVCGLILFLRCTCRPLDPLPPVSARACRMCVRARCCGSNHGVNALF